MGFFSLELGQTWFYSGNCVWSFIWTIYSHGKLVKKHNLLCKKRFQIMLSKPRKLMKVKQHGVSQVNPIWAKLFTLMLSCHLCQFTCISSPPKLYKYALLLFFINFFDNDDMKSLKCHDALLLLIFLLKFLCTACFQIS